MKKLTEMLKLKEKIESAKIMKVMNLAALAMVVYTANSACLWLHHQPKVPEDVKAFRKF